VPCGFFVLFLLKMYENHFTMCRSLEPLAVEEPMAFPTDNQGGVT
jgi:hypothetical protein